MAVVEEGEGKTETIHFDKVAIIGVGLIGGSLALALREKGAVGTVVGVGRGLPNLNAAMELGVVDSVTREVAESVGRTI